MYEQSVSLMDSLGAALAPLGDSDGVLGGVVCGEDGLSLAAVSRDSVDRDAIAAAGAWLGKLARRSGARVVLVDASRLMIIIRPVSLGYLVVAANPAASIEDVLATSLRVSEALNQAGMAPAMAEAV
ncbi:MAG: hypothetical protein ACE149_12570 [Armatimonadota bacterium]